jgi:type IV pilus assembly protein PilM
MRLPFNFKDRFSRDKFSVGIDIGTHSIKAVKLKFLKESVELCGFDVQPNQLDSALVIKKIKEAMPCEFVNVSFCGPSTVIRYASFPKMNPAEFRQALSFEAQKHIPFSLSEINFDGAILKEDLPENKMLVSIAAVKKEPMSQRLKLLNDCGLKANIVDIDSLALVNAFNFNYPIEDKLKNKTIALLNIGAQVSNLNILENAIPRFSRDILIAGNTFTQKLSEILGIDLRSAEELKHKPEGEKADKVKIASESVLNNLANEVRTSFDYYESQSTSSVVKIFLSGGGSKLAGLQSALANLLGIEVESWEALKQINLSSNIDSVKLKSAHQELAVAVGLALRQ